MVNQTKLRGVIAILKNAGVLLTKTPVRDAHCEVVNLLIIEFVEEEVCVVASEAIMEEAEKKKNFVYMKSSKLKWPMKSQNLARDILFFLFAETVTIFIKDVAVEIIAESPVTLPKIEIEKEAILLEMDETVMVYFMCW